VKKLAILPGMLALVALTACSDAPRATEDPRIPPEVRQYADDWPLPGRDYLNSPCCPSIGPRPPICHISHCVTR
jgi:hypothetical protein